MRLVKAKWQQKQTQALEIRMSVVKRFRRTVQKAISQPHRPAEQDLSKAIESLFEQYTNIRAGPN